MSVIMLPNVYVVRSCFYQTILYAICALFSYLATISINALTYLLT